MIILYSTGCPKCLILEKKLKEKGISYCISNNVTELVEKGFQSLPVLQVEDSYFDFSQAIKWLKEV